MTECRCALLVVFLVGLLGCSGSETSSAATSTTSVPTDAGTDASPPDPPDATSPLGCPQDAGAGGVELLRDPLDDATDPTGLRVSVTGGTFVAGQGWRTRDKDPNLAIQDCNTDQLRFEIPSSALADPAQGLRRGCIAFDVTNWHGDDTTFPETYNQNGDEVTPHWIFYTMGEGSNPTVVQDPYYLKMGVFDYHVSLRQNAGAECGGYYDDDAYSVHDFAWSGSETYHYELSWTPETTTWRINGIVAAERDFSLDLGSTTCDYTPAALFITLGAKPGMAVWGSAPFGIVVSNLVVIDWTSP